MDAWRLQGRVSSGRGDAAGFTQLDWVRRAAIETMGIDPWPGTLNLLPADRRSRQRWRDLRSAPWPALPGAPPQTCTASCRAVHVATGLPAGIILPQVPDYPPEQIEILAAVPLRQQLGLSDGSIVELRAPPRPRLAAVLFDVDGTLVNSVDAYHIAAGRAAARHGLAVNRELVRRALNEQLPFWELVLPPAQQGDRALIAELRAETMRHWPAVLAEEVQLFAGVVDTFASLRAAGLQLGIYSGSRGESFAPLREAGLLALCDLVLTADDVERPKPQPDGLLLASEQLGLAPSACAYVGDSVPDMQAAAAAGMLPIGVLSGAGDSRQLSLAGAAYLAAEHRGALEIIESIIR